MTMRAFLNAVRWPGASTGPPSQPRRPVRYRGLSVEPLEDRRVLSAGSFVAALYQDVLGRAPDASGRNFYTNLLATSTPPSAVVAVFWESAEHRGIEVDSYYQTFFNRAADPAGRQAWIDNMLAGVAEETVMADFLNSPEFQQLNPSPTQFVSGLYQDVLGRAPDPSGLATWVTELTGNTAAPADIVGVFVDSTERHLNLVDSYYATFLQRAPDTAGQTAWVQQLDQGLATDASAAENFQTSQEFIDDNPLPPFVAGPGQVVVTVVGNGFVTDSTGQIDTRTGQNVAIYGANDFPILQASSPSVTWSDPALSGQNPVLSASDYANGLDVTAFFF
jgi:hypothetical protein